MTETSERQYCIVCGERLPERSWWQRWFGNNFPSHTQKGAEGDACWVALNQKMGNPDPGPKPDKKSGRW